MKYFLVKYFMLFGFLFSLSFGVFGKNDPTTYCELDRQGGNLTSRHTAIIFDLTDPYNSRQIKNIVEWVNNYASKLNTGERLNFFSFDKSNGFHTSVVSDSFCVAGNPPWITAPRTIKIQKKKEEERILKFFIENNPKSGTAGSPIIDAVVSASRSQIFKSLSTEFHLILISDLVEYSDFFKLSNSPLSYDAIDSLVDKVDRSFKFPLSNSEVTILFVQRESYRQVQSGEALELLWRRLFKKFGAVGDVTITRIN